MVNRHNLSKKLAIYFFCCVGARRVGREVLSPRPSNRFNCGSHICTWYRPKVCFSVLSYPNCICSLDSFLIFKQNTSKILSVFLVLLKDHSSSFTNAQDCT